MSISASSFYQNRADNGGGGAIWTSTSTSTSITNSSFMMNIAGAGGAIESQHGTTNISFSTFNDSAGNGNGNEIAGKANILGSVLASQGTNCGGLPS